MQAVMVRPHRHMRSRHVVGVAGGKGTTPVALGISCLRLAIAATLKVPVASLAACSAAGQTWKHVSRRIPVVHCVYDYASPDQAEVDGAWPSLKIRIMQLWPSLVPTAAPLAIYQEGLPI